MAGRVVLLAALLALTPRAAHAVRCGDVITRNAVLTEDVGPCPPQVDPVLTVVGPAILDLNGHTVDCAATSGSPETGILLDGRGAKLRNGTVQRCNGQGVFFGGDGRHVVQQVVSRQNSNDGFEVASSKNALLASTAIDNRDDGIAVTGPGNALAGNLVLRSGSVGITVIGQGDTLQRNVVMSSQLSGFGISGTAHRLSDNRAIGNLDGFRVLGEGHRLIGNQAIANGRGIDVQATACTIAANVAQLDEDVDLADASQDCDHNVWRQNVFTTASQACIR